MGIVRNFAATGNREIPQSIAVLGITYVIEVVHGRQFVEGIEAFCIVHTLAEPPKITLVDALTIDQRFELLAEALDYLTGPGWESIR